MKVLAWMLLLLLFIATPCFGAILDYTIPSYQQNLIYDPDTNTWNPSCEAGTIPLTNIKFTRIYKYNSNSTNLDKWDFVRDKDVEFREGQPDTLVINESGNYHIRSVNTNMIESCGSNIVYVGSPTDVPIQEPPLLYVKETHYFDVRGRLVRDPDHAARGLYLKVDLWNNGKRTSKKVRLH